MSELTVFERASTPLVSIVVPTKNRGKYAKRMIESILSIPSDEFELVISDNSDDDDLEIYIKEREADPRLAYCHVQGIFSMTDNHNLAFARVRGEYVFLIGDDDTVLPEVIAVAKWAKKEGWDAVTPLSTPCYFWPDVRHWFWGSKQSSMMYAQEYTGNLKELNPREAVEECLRHAGQGVHNLPKTYHGLVRYSCMTEIKRRTGDYFRGVSPDVYGALALGCVVKRYCHLDFPISIAGVAGGSNSGRAAMKQHKGNLSTDPHMVAYRDLEWPRSVPEFFSVETVWAEASIEAINAFDLSLKKFNFELLYAKCLVNHGAKIRDILRSIYHRSHKNYFQMAIHLSTILLRVLFLTFNKSFYYIGRLLHPTPAGKFEAITGGTDIVNASIQYQCWRENKNLIDWTHET